MMKKQVPLKQLYMFPRLYGATLQPCNCYIL